ncbi:unnamed protein product [Acanthoscelides obtectus]|uniref:Uncharacterized protein n=2 Tax=Acanthoscelides obtectus TaxID=200917 RepID=A0A9P0KWI3_ACAOB|nr:unnamed protein product [Acanthoscelides obtectus]
MFCAHKHKCILIRLKTYPFPIVDFFVYTVILYV